MPFGGVDVAVFSRMLLRSRIPLAVLLSAASLMACVAAPPNASGPPPEQTAPTTDGGAHEAAASSEAGNSPPEHLPLGIATLLPGETCEGRSQFNAACSVINVTCPRIADIVVELREIAPVGGDRGTIVLGSGGGGIGFGEGEYGEIIETLRQVGYRIVLRRYRSSDQAGWLASQTGFNDAGCRYATVLTHIKGAAHKAGAFCASGNSGGAGEIGLALAHYGRDQILDFALPTSGPMGRVDHVCLGERDPAWATECKRLTSATGKTWTCRDGSKLPPCEASAPEKGLLDSAFGQTRGACSAPTPEATTFMSTQGANVATARFDYPNTLVRFLYGLEDCQVVVPTGLEYADRVISKGAKARIDFLEAVGHAMPSSPAGQAAIVSALQDGCKKP